jgi:DNA-binding response OmpR family regulator
MEKKYKILIVEDDPLIRTIYLERLSIDEEIEVDTAVDGLDGLNKIKVNTYNLVFSGIQMPNKTGFELFQDLQADSNLSNMPFVIFSHLGRLEDIQKARDLGIKNFIIRGSTTPDEVAKKIRDILYNNIVEQVNTKQYKILIVEDKPEIRSIYVDRFGQHSAIIIDEAVDGVDGLNKIKENTYDLIFSGIYMPNKTGFELFQEVQKLKDKKHIPIVLFSHWGKSEDIEMARQLGVQYFIIRGQSTPNNILNQILDILNAQDKTYQLVIKKESQDYSKFIESFFGEDCIEYKYNDGLPIKVILSKDVKPYNFFIELDCEDK